MSSNIKKNIGFQTFYEILNSCLPLITAPYLARVLGASQLGVFSYTQSIVNYFVLLAMLGVKNYGTRSIAEVRDDKNECNQRFCEIYSLQLITAVASMSIYFLYCLVICNKNIIIAYIQIISVLACVFDINWLFSGLEKFKITVTRSVIVRILTVVLIILLVKKPEDLWIYTILMVGGHFVGIIVLWKYVTELIGRFKFKIHGLKKHIKPNILLFLPLMAMSVYHLMDKTMLGSLSTYEQTGFYYNVDKVINIPIGVITGIGTVMLPRITSMVSLGKKEEANRLFLVSVEGVSVVAVAMSTGIIAIIKDFVPFFFGPGYDACVFLTILLAPVLFVKAISLTVRNEYLIPNKKDKIYIYSVIFGAISNLLVNCLLIPRLGAVGAVIGTLVAESVACLWQLISIAKNINIFKSLLKSLPYCGFGLVMILVVRFFEHYFNCSHLIKLILEIPIGATVYISLCVLFWVITRNNLLSLFGFDEILKKYHIKK